MRILIVDDNRDITTLFSELFTLKNHECVALDDGKKAVKTILEERFDRIILDLSMPGFSGEDILKKVSEEKNLEFMHIIVLTASDISKEREFELKQLGVKKILKKPISLNKIEEGILN